VLGVFQESQPGQTGRKVSPMSGKAIAVKKTKLESTKGMSQAEFKTVLRRMKTVVVHSDGKSVNAKPSPELPAIPIAIVIEAYKDAVVRNAIAFFLTEKEDKRLLERLEWSARELGQFEYFRQVNPRLSVIFDFHNEPTSTSTSTPTSTSAPASAAGTEEQLSPLHQSLSDLDDYSRESIACLAVTLASTPKGLLKTMVMYCLGRAVEMYWNLGGFHDAFVKTEKATDKVADTAA
jgi:hypothetical protein